MLDLGEITHAGQPGGGGFVNTQMPVTVTSPAVPGVVLMLLCGSGAMGEHCLGILDGP